MGVVQSTTRDKSGYHIPTRMCSSMDCKACKNTDPVDCIVKNCPCKDVPEKERQQFVKITMKSKKHPKRQAQGFFLSPDGKSTYFPSKELVVNDRNRDEMKKRLVLMQAAQDQLSDADLKLFQNDQSKFASKLNTNGVCVDMEPCVSGLEDVCCKNGSANVPMTGMAPAAINNLGSIEVEPNIDVSVELDCKKVNIEGFGKKRKSKLRKYLLALAFVYILHTQEIDMRMMVFLLACFIALRRMI